MEKNEVLQLSNELTYRHYLMDRGKIKDIFRKVSIPEYIALQAIVEENNCSAIYFGKTYLKDLAERLQISIRQTSKMMGVLKDRGLIEWSHDGKGSEGTYVLITENGKRLVTEQESILKSYYEKVIQKYGKDNFLQLLQMMKQLETVMSEEMEAVQDYGRVDELD